MERRKRSDEEIILRKSEEPNTRSFLSIQILNDTLDELRNYRDRGGEETEFTKALPSNKIINGASTDEVDLYFKAWNRAKKINAINRKNSNVPS